MENNLKVYKSDRFDVENTASLSLFIYPSSLFIFCKDQNESNLAIHHYLSFDVNKIDQLLTADHLLRIDVPAKVYIHSDLFSLVPGVLFLTGEEKTYLGYTSELEEKSHFFSTPLDSNNIQLVSCISGKIKKTLEARFSEVQFYHGAVSFLSYLFKERFNLIGQEILIDYFHSHIYLAAFTDQDLSAFNMFEVSSKEDLLKYAFIVLEQLKYDRNHVRITVFGASEASGISEAWGKEYFHHFRIIRPHANQNYSHGFKHLKSEKLFEADWQYS